MLRVSDSHEIVVQVHNLKVRGSNPLPATNEINVLTRRGALGSQSRYARCAVDGGPTQDSTPDLRDESWRIGFERM
jgi:hypothetical protein